MLCLSEMIRKVEEWLGEFAYDANICNVFQISDPECKAYKVVFEEGMEADKKMLTVYSNGIIMNANNEDVCEVGLSAYSYDEKIVKWIKDFQNKWYID